MVFILDKLLRFHERLDRLCIALKGIASVLWLRLSVVGEDTAQFSQLILVQPIQCSLKVIQDNSVVQHLNTDVSVQKNSDRVVLVVWHDHLNTWPALPVVYQL